MHTKEIKIQDQDQLTNITLVDIYHMHRPFMDIYSFHTTLNENKKSIYSNLKLHIIATPLYIDKLTNNENEYY